MSEWQPISTAPRDGTPVLLGGRWLPFETLPGGEWCSVVALYGSMSSYAEDAGDWFAGVEQVASWNVAWTHWMPLPDPPDAGGE